MDPNKLKQFREAAIKAGYKSADVDKFLSQKQQELATMELVKAGQLDFKSFAQSSPVLANKLIKQGYQPQASSDPEEQFADIKAQQGIESLGAEDQFIAEARGGKLSVPQLLSKYSQLDPTGALQQYNRVSPYGPATEDPEQLAQYGIDVTKLGYQSPSKTSTQNQKAEAGINVTKELETIPQNIRDKTGSKEAFNAMFKLKIPVFGPALIRGETEGKLVDLETKYFLLVQTALTAIQGSRPSDYDVKSYMDKAGPSIRNSPKVNEDRINNLKKLMEGAAGKTSSSQSRPPLTNFLIP